MKAISLKAPGKFEYIELPDVTEGDLGKEEVLVRVCHVGLCGTDIHAYRGNQPFFDYPRILGHELGVEVLATGSSVKNVKTGMHCSVEAYISSPVDRAYARGKTNCSRSTKCLGVQVDGGMREKMVLPAWMLHPSSLSTRSLALVETLCIGHHAVERAALIGDEMVAVIGLGPIGLGVAQFARLAGCRVVAVDMSAERLQKASSLYPGLDTLKLKPSGDLSSTWEEKLGDPPEVVWDCTGNQASMEAAIALADFGGRVVLVGIYKGDLSFSDPDFHRRELSLLSSRNARAANFRSVIHLMENGLVASDPWITHECGLDEFKDVIESWLKPGSGLLKGIIHFA